MTGQTISHYRIGSVSGANELAHYTRRLARRWEVNAGPLLRRYNLTVSRRLGGP